MSMFTKLAYGAASVALLAAAPAAVYAQQTTAQVRGVIVDASGNPVSGASVTIRFDATGAVSNATTSANGTYFATGLRPGGPYTITVSGAGETLVQEDINLSSGQPEIFNAVLGAGDSSIESIVVRGSAVQNELQLNGGVGSVFSASDLAAQPSINRDVISSLLSDPLVSSTELSGRGRNNGTISIAGQPPRFNGFVIDGLAQQNDFGLDQGLFPTLRQPVSIEWIEESSVQIADYSVLSTGFTGGLVNVITKSGTNEIDGGLYYYTFDDGLVGDEAFDEEVTSNFEETEWGAFVSGPIIEDKLFFFAGYETVENTFPVSRNLQDVDEQMFTIIRDLVQDNYGYDAGLPSDTSVTEESTRYTGKIDWNINEDHTLTASYTYSEDSQLSNAGTFNFPTTYYTLSSEQDVYRAELNSSWTDNFSTIFRVARKEYVRGQDSLGDTSATGTSAGQFTIRVNDSDPYLNANNLEGLIGDSSRTFRLGPDVFRHHNAFEDERTIFFGQGDYVWGDHLITFGGQYEQYDLFNVFGQFSRGEFIFNDLQDLIDGVAEINYINAFSNDSNDVIADWGYEQTSLFIQDSWQVTPTFNVNFGVRYDRISQDDTPPAPEDSVLATDPDTLASFESIYGFSGRDTLDGVDLIQPRVGFTWDASDRLTVSGGYGIYSGGNPQVWISNNYTAATGAFFGYDATGVDIFNVPSALQGIIANGIGVPTLDAGSNRRSFNAVHNVDVLDPNFDMPYVTRASLRADYNLDLNRWGFGLGDDYRVSASVVYGKQDEALIWRNLAFERADLAGSVGIAPDGRPIYPDLGDIPDPADPTNSSREFNIPDAFMITTTEGGDSLSFSVQVAKDYDNGFGFNVGYANTQADDLLEYTSSRAVSAWRGIVGTDRNNPAVGTSSNEVEHRFTARFSYENEFFGDLTSRFNVRGIIQSGSPFSYGYNIDREPVFGRANGGSPRDGADLLYIPNIENGVFNDSRVVFETATDEADFLAFVNQYGLAQYAGSIAPRNSDRSPWVQRWDFRFSQELPGISYAERFVGENRFALVLDIENFPNLLNDEWGQVVRRPSNGRVNAVTVEMQDAAGNFLRNNETGEVCKAAGDCQYIYSNVASQVFFNEDENNSVYRVRVGLRYEF
ncbi:TonB-dependent receptor domain-containing protein [Maricaulis sp. D1M11]